MNHKGEALKNDEMAILNFKTLYQKFGYKQYKMSKFEEYDLYVQNKNFLVSDNIITFNDMNGKLMALKPDVTLSIVKNTKDDNKCLEKVYYSENVYRVANGTHEFKEIMQVGLECIGDIDIYSMGEVIMLAAKSLQTISDEFILDISHMGFMTAILDSADLSVMQKDLLLEYISNKNVHEIKKACSEIGVSEEFSEKIIALASLYGSFENTLDLVRKISINDKTDAAVKELENIYEILKLEGYDKNINLDFSIVNDMNYYNGIIFQGFIDGIPCSVLSGGRYDNLLHKFGKKSGAVGFAIHLDLLERLMDYEKPYDVDILLVYDSNTDATAIAKAVKMFSDNGKSVRAEKTLSDKIKYKQLICMKDGRLEIIEADD